MTGDRPTTPGWHCHRCRSTSCRQRADSDTDHVGRVEYRPLLLTQPSSVSWLWSHTHWCPSQRPQEVTRVDGSANPTMPLNPTPYELGGTGRGTNGAQTRGLYFSTLSPYPGLGSYGWKAAPFESRTAPPLPLSNGQRPGNCRWSRRPAQRRPPPRRAAAQSSVNNK